MSNAVPSAISSASRDRKKSTYLENQSELKQMWLSKSNHLALSIVNYVIVYLQNEIQRTMPNARIVFQPYFVKNFVGIQYEISMANDNSSVVLSGTTNVIRFRPAKKRTTVIYIPINITKSVKAEKFAFAFEHKHPSEVLQFSDEALYIANQLEGAGYAEDCINTLNAYIIDRIMKA